MFYWLFENSHLLIQYILIIFHCHLPSAPFIIPPSVSLSTPCPLFIMWLITVWDLTRTAHTCTGVEPSTGVWGPCRSQVPTGEWLSLRDLSTANSNSAKRGWGGRWALGPSSVRADWSILYKFCASNHSCCKVMCAKARSGAEGRISHSLPIYRPLFHSVPRPWMEGARERWFIHSWALSTPYIQHFGHLAKQQSSLPCSRWALEP